MRAPAITFALATFLNFPAFADAWTQTQGNGQWIVSASNYMSDRYYDSRGKKQTQDNYTSYTLNPYIEYGLTDRLTVGGNFFLQEANQDSLSNVALGESDLFARYKLWQRGGFVLSVQPTVVLPRMFSAMQQPRIGSATPDAGGGLLAGYGFDLFGQHHFTSLGSTYLYRFGTPKDQLNSAATLGIGLTPRLMIMPQLFLTNRMGTPETASFTNSSGDDYNLVTLRLSAVYKWDKDTSLQIAGFSDFSGKNAGIGNGVVLAIWEDFDAAAIRRNFTQTEPAD